MAETQHTEGPWSLINIEGKLCPASGRMSILTVVYEDGRDFAAVYNDADAHLIAAAPDLLEALKALELQALQSNVNSTSNEWGREALDLARAAIAKASPALSGSSL